MAIEYVPVRFRILSVIPESPGAPEGHGGGQEQEQDPGGAHTPLIYPILDRRNRQRKTR